MGVIDYGGVIVHGNFAELQPSKPEDFDYMSDAKWLEPYPFEWRETLGSTICNCIQLECHYAPYYGFDYYHRDTCNLMRKLQAEPGISNLYEVYLPSLTHYTTAVDNPEHIPLYIAGRSRSKAVKVTVKPLVDAKQIPLI